MPVRANQNGGGKMVKIKHSDEVIYHQQHQVLLIARIRLIHFRHPSRSSHHSRLVFKTASSVRTELKNMSLHVGQHFCVNVWESTIELCLWVHPCFSSRVQRLIVLLGWFVRCEPCGRTAAMLLGAASRMYSKELTTSEWVFSKCFTKVQMVQPYNITDMIIAWNNSHFFLSVKWFPYR